MDDTAQFAAPDEAGSLKHTQVLAEAGQRHVERFGQSTDRLGSGGQSGQNAAAGRVGQGGKYGVQSGVPILNHKVQY